jgi:hypothetical protein
MVATAQHSQGFILWQQASSRQASFDSNYYCCCLSHQHARLTSFFPAIPNSTQAMMTLFIHRWMSPLTSL